MDGFRVSSFWERAVFIAAVATTPEDMQVVAYILSHIPSLTSSLKFQVSFAKEPYKRDYNLQKRPTI